MKDLNKSACSRKWKVLLSICVSSILITQTVNAKETDTYISKTIYDACVKYANEYCICPELVMAIIERESTGDKDATNGNCKGLMQVSEKWHVERMDKLGVTDIYDVSGNIHVGADYLSELFLEYEDPALVLMIYHGEKDAIEKYNHGEISDYATGILERTKELEILHETKSREEMNNKCLFRSFGAGYLLSFS